ncbi:hypothetical protein LZ31DRAFT_198923 [Colletotrichum somersetense]|nr:hypothetical protein LZ31DRAFT_198923 [Colletotrichum somersetense]
MRAKDGEPKQGKQNAQKTGRPVDASSLRQCFFPFPPLLLCLTHTLSLSFSAFGMPCPFIVWFRSVRRRSKCKKKKKKK